MIDLKYGEMLKKLYQTNLFSSGKVDLCAISKACRLFNNVEKSLNFIHVAGTNGKGSVCKKLSEIFSSSGYKTGLFTSPHITTFRERIQINSQMIPKSYIAENLDIVMKILHKNNNPLTYFELVTLFSLLYFRDMKCDYGIIEVGLGGNMDATNIIHPILSVITSIGYDHMDVLGQTLKEIAEKKAGIIKRNTPVVVGQDAKPISVFIKRAKEMNADLYQSRNDDPSSFKSFDEENQITVKKCIDVLVKHYPEKMMNVGLQNIEYGLRQVQPCRMENVFKTLDKTKMAERFKTSKLPSKIYLDVGHNSHAMEKLFAGLKNKYPQRPIKVISGFASNKDKMTMLKIIAHNSDKIYLISSDNPRLTPYAELLRNTETFVKSNPEYFNKFTDLALKTTGKINETITRVTKDSNENDILLICGSFFIMKDVRKCLGYEDEKDPFNLNENATPTFNYDKRI